MLLSHSSSGLLKPYLSLKKNEYSPFSLQRIVLILEAPDKDLRTYSSFTLAIIDIFSSSLSAL